MERNPKRHPPSPISVTRRRTSATALAGRFRCLVAGYKGRGYGRMGHDERWWQIGSRMRGTAPETVGFLAFCNDSGYLGLIGFWAYFIGLQIFGFVMG
ncbi:hypothetical protein ERO13_D12G200400v2 [Gossypium hirsutum]|uniref:Uncharacterized protein n=3 Tax=Gossypium TaxID=3633 RepID=A0A5D2SHT0_GOSMU|nr:hypothetical protein ERO13_D12G200400v2 [Gossypium hirsutum]TYG42176.1 hypothetical protein ES288_D12G236700v1 [Gossypium darwinii]TYH40298.1 hypothetical protein ES332_D12G237800v1 [Gossypium tomentosum]TYI52160.1 hypothetical protein E1A91_D12G227900v1 [Gossypium mustelinum]